MKKPTIENLRKPFKLQMLYFVFAMAFNFSSLFVYQSMGRSFCSLSAPKTTAFLGVLIVTALSLTVFLNNRIFYAIATGIAACLIFYGGVMPHISRMSSIDLYLNPIAWMAALCINIYGVIAFVYGTVRALKKTEMIGGEVKHG